ncbi:DNA replication and repair protein RecN [Anaerobacterium chartisolvens]|uniref:DNA repair protein RecN n=1 Tax=Anaerobacterium chartisolvens TaxID=1297424 RepID=A0A369B5U7_9FIRM|nr:DNA repair protein RecN [Anaerobacterium chartisolvens]RCX16811.1 DNA replication and repair protein RecN [Anaerobacterium chartisolvens]
MLTQLHIHNIALINSVTIEPGSGLNILTGETGAGKSIIIDSINAILGGRVSKELIRTGKDKASVEAVFKMPEGRVSDLLESYGIDEEEDGTLIISREFTVSGKNTCRINGRMATVSMLKSLGQRMIDIHGQHDNQSLLRTEDHIDMLDSFGEEAIKRLRQEYSSLLLKYNGIKSRLKELSGDFGQRERKIDLLQFQIDEIKKARLKPGEEQQLNKQRSLLSNSGKISQALSHAYELLFTGNEIKASGCDSINEALTALKGISGLDGRFGDIALRLEDICYQLEDITKCIRDERDTVEYDPDLLEHIEERIDVIHKLAKKYGPSVEDILRYCGGIEQELEDIIRGEEIIKELEQELKSLSKGLLSIAHRLHDERNKAARLLEREIAKELEDLEMKKAKFKVNIVLDGPEECSAEGAIDIKFMQNGLDKVEFLISSNPGEPLKPLSKIVSGGEMSRIMLAIKTILASEDNVPTLIFDEIDTGISGRAAQKVGEKLCLISSRHQVICVTHLAQIACMADHNFLIEKITGENTAETDIKPLKGVALRDEIARILGGASISSITLKHAEEMLANSRDFKNK